MTCHPAVHRLARPHQRGALLPPGPCRSGPVSGRAELHFPEPSGCGLSAQTRSLIDLVRRLFCASASQFCSPGHVCGRLETFWLSQWGEGVGATGVRWTESR